MSTYPSYLGLYKDGTLQERIDSLSAMLESCTLCPRNCGVNRLEGKMGVCRAGKKAVVSDAFPHFGEEPPLTGRGGSGTIFFSNCNLRCVFCQNYGISHLGEGSEADSGDLAGMMLKLQRSGCHNINLVTPTHYAPQIIAALPAAIEGGLELPIVWNCGGFESAEVIRLLDGIVDIYMPDMKYSDDVNSIKYSKAPFYFRVAKEAVREMHSQVGDLEVDASGIARRGLLIRHLVMPGGVAGSERVINFIAEEISRNSYLNIMDQYHPCYRAGEFPEIDRPVSEDEFSGVIAYAREAGLERIVGWL